MTLPITHIRNVGLFTPNLEEHVRFYTEVWGLQPVDSREDAVYLRGSSGESYLLSLHRRYTRGLHHVSYAMASEDSVRTGAAVLEEKGVRIVQAPGLLDQPGAGFGFRFVDPDGRCIELSSGVAEHSGGWNPRSVQPHSLCHVVLNTPDIDRIAGFYTNLLGFRISDWSEHQMVFLRTSSKHHSVSFNQAPHASVNHMAYLVSGVDEVMRGVSSLRKHGIEPAWGPGRHGPGNNIFCYFTDPMGYVTEYTSDIDYIPDEASHQPKVWSRSLDAIDRWGLNGPPTPALREAMTGEPDKGWANGST